jgi:hypothetical protein
MLGAACTDVVGCGSSHSTQRKAHVKPVNIQTLLFGLLLTALLVLPWNAQCRIGETLDECKARYGNPVEAKKDTALFLKNAIYVSVHFADGRVDEISYSKRDPKDSKKSVRPSDAEVNILLRANAPDTSWEVEVAHRHDVLWKNKQKGLSAFRTQNALTISIFDPIAYKAYHERKAATRELEGF